ncbi:carbohydrate ABC transporter permease [bacterium]|nr:carbohydrate ABC transporter permease [bacterium]
MEALRTLKRRHISSWAYILLAIFVAAMTFLPFYWAISLSVRNPAEAFTVTGLAVPFVQYKPTLANWKTELATGETQKALVNSTIVAMCAALMTIVIATPAAYAIARFRFRRPSNGNIALWFLSQRVLPPVATAIPFFLIMRFLGLLDTHIALILLNTTFNLPIVVVIMRQAFIEVPIELEEAALVDGANHLDIFLMISVRLAAPSLAAAVLIVIAFTWNEFLFALMIGTIKAKVIPVHMAGAVDTRGVQFWFVAVRTLIAMTPPVIIALLAQRYIVRGLTFGAVKG